MLLPHPVIDQQLAQQGRSVRRTVEPTTAALGAFTRAHANTIHGMALACLVAATRYELVETLINPALQADELVISDRYLPSTLVLQQLTGSPPSSCWTSTSTSPSPPSPT
ncbi:hypothetical protein [Streptomyces sp. NPDC091219]|uniref:dTMP kinase n=1 Tax=Streptomyces sp. NPDC091219 TaxID=3155193 RepID=UPI00344D4D26